MELTGNDEEALLKRNDFLHGRIPFEDEDESKKDQELRYITYKLHFLVSILILKYAGFEGFVKNNPRFSALTIGNKLINEPFFRLI